MPLHSAGILLYRFRESCPEVLLVHPGGPYFSKKDEGVWSIPKGLLEDGEDGLATAKREFREELGVDVPQTEFFQLASIRQKGGKIVQAWAGEGNVDASAIQSNTFRMEFPYKSGRWIDVPEVDRAGWFDFDTAGRKILPAQQPLIDELATLLAR